MAWLTRTKDGAPREWMHFAVPDYRLNQCRPWRGRGRLIRPISDFNGLLAQHAELVRLPESNSGRLMVKSQLFGNDLRLVLLLIRFCGLDAFAKVARMTAVERLGDRPLEIAVLGKISHHLGPSHGLEQNPMPSTRHEHGDNHAQLAKLGQARKHSASFSLQIAKEQAGSSGI